MTYYKLTYFADTTHKTDNIEVIISETENKEFLKKVENLMISLLLRECVRCGKHIKISYANIKPRALCKACYLKLKKRLKE